MTPAPGYAIVQETEQGKTAAGLHVPATAQQDTTATVVATSDHYYVQGTKCPTFLTIGDVVLLAPNSPALAHDALPKGQAVVMINHVVSIASGAH